MKSRDKAVAQTDGSGLHGCEVISLHALLCGVLAESIYEGLRRYGALPARRFAADGLCAAALAAGLTLLFAWLCGRKSDVLRRVCAALVAVAAAAGTALTAWQILDLFRVESPDSLGWAAVFVATLLWVRTTPHTLNSAAGLLGWAALLAALLLVAGLYGQMDWARLEFAMRMPGKSAMGPVGRIGAVLCFYPEYLAAAWLSARGRAELCALPGLDLGVRFAILTAAELLFGVSEVSGRELLRAWSLGMFSRFDGAALFIWLLLAMQRILLLWWCARQAGHATLAPKKNAQRKAPGGTGDARGAGGETGAAM